ncbi:MAG: tetratricopeptide repeat protein [Bryobacteraceae bacterium]
MYTAILGHVLPRKVTGNHRTAAAAHPSSPAPLLDRFRWQAGLLALLVLIAYANSLASSFHFDDAAIFANPSILKPGFGWGIFRLEQTRPLTYLTFHWNYLVGGQNPVLYHWVNLLLHAANSILVLVLARRYLSPFTAGCVAVLFALHPLQTESVTYVYARSTLLSTHFALWVLWFHARGKYLGSALLFGLSLLAKEETIALPGFLLLLDLFVRRRPRIGYYAALAAIAGLAACRLSYAIHASPVDPGVGRVRGIPAASYLLTQSRVLWIYLRLMIAPLGLNLDRDVPLSTSLLSPWTTLAAILALALLGAALLWLAWKKHSEAALWALGFFVLISPSSSIVAQADVIFEHRTYLPMICATMALGFLLEAVPRAKLAIAFAALIPVMFAATISRNADWHDEKTLWTDIAAKSPQKGRSWLGLASLYWNDPGKAREYLSKGLAVDPNNGLLHTNYGIVLLSANEPAEALAHFQRAMAMTGETADRWNNIGAAYYKMNDLEASLRSFERALRLDPCNFNVRRNLITLYSGRNQQQAALQAGAVPATCTMLPEQAKELDALRQQIAGP